MDHSPRICVLIPVYNHSLTVRRVVEEANRLFPVIVVDDGSTDQTAEILKTLKDIVLLRLPENLGKAAALRAGFAKAEEIGLTHVISLDADGQHPTAALPQFAALCRSNPQAFIIGVRNFKTVGAPLPRRLCNAISTFWFRIETGLRLADSQCGYRVYPLPALRRIEANSQRYAFELEIMVKAAWAGIPLLALPVETDYTALTSRLSHFNPILDLAQISLLHWRLTRRALAVRLQNPFGWWGTTAEKSKDFVWTRPGNCA